MTKTRVCVRAIPGSLSKGIQRVAIALERYKPEWAEIVQDPKDADLWIVHVIGHGSMTEAKDFNGDLAMIQYCMLTTEDSRPEAWLPYWNRSKVVWSYYDLFEYLHVRNVPFLDAQKMNFYHAPLGVDGAVFRPSVPLRKRFIIGTSGYIAETEGVRECYQAARRLDRDHFHLGPNLNLGPGTTYLMGLRDIELAEFWSQCSFVAGLRRIEGFELPALEGLMCGARPIMFDAPHYRRWFGEHAEYVPEVGAEELVDHLTHVMERPVRVVSAAERVEVLRKFNWKDLCERFWEALV